MKIKKSKGNDAEQLQTLSQRLTYAFNALGISKADLARKINVSPQAINYLCHSKATKSRLTYDIAEGLGISGDWLATGNGFMIAADDPQYKLIQTQHAVPIITQEQIKKYSKDLNQLFINEPLIDYLFTNANTGAHGFAISIQDKSMYPRFDQRTIVFVNPEKIPKEKEFVIAYIAAIEDVIFRQIEYSNAAICLKPINTSMYKPIVLTQTDKILGTLVEARTPLE